MITKKLLLIVVSFLLVLASAIPALAQSDTATPTHLDWGGAVPVVLNWQANAQGFSFNYESEAKSFTCIWRGNNCIGKWEYSNGSAGPGWFNRDYEGAWCYGNVSLEALAELNIEDCDNTWHLVFPETETSTSSPATATPTAPVEVEVTPDLDSTFIVQYLGALHPGTLNLEVTECPADVEADTCYTGTYRYRYSGRVALQRTGNEVSGFYREAIVTAATSFTITDEGWWIGEWIYGDGRRGGFWGWFPGLTTEEALAEAERILEIEPETTPEAPTAAGGLDTLNYSYQDGEITADMVIDGRAARFGGQCEVSFALVGPSTGDCQGELTWLDPVANATIEATPSVTPSPTVTPTEAPAEELTEREVFLDFANPGDSSSGQIFIEGLGWGTYTLECTLEGCTGVFSLAEPE